MLSFSPGHLDLFFKQLAEPFAPPLNFRLLPGQRWRKWLAASEHH